MAHTENSMDSEFSNNSIRERFELTVEGDKAFIDYRIRNGILYLTHTEVPENMRGNGIGTALVKQALQYIKSKGLQIKSLCPFISEYLQKHPKWNSVVAS